MDLEDTVKIMVPGQVVLDRFKLVKRIGRGGMGIVWLARDQTLNLDVALKFLPEAVRSDPAALDDLKSEARKSIRLTHPSIVRIHDFIEAPEAAGISMEYIDGLTLAQLRIQQKDKVFEAHELAGWVAQLCEALTYAHVDAKLVHRDLKPGNLMIAGGNRLKVADFGISRSLSDTINRATRENIVSGTLAYMSPQQLHGEQPDPRDDIYSLGATLFDLLTGKPPFYSGDITAQIEDKHPPTVTERRREFKTPNAAVPEEWEAAISACLQKKAEKRPQTAAEFAARLRLPANSGSYVVVDRERSTRRRPALIALLILCALVGLFIALDFLGRPEPGPTSHEDSRREEIVDPVRSDSPLDMAGFIADSANLKLPEIPGEGPGGRFTNSLGMILVPIERFYGSIWETRVGDYQRFVDAGGFIPAPGAMRVMTESGWGPDPEASWRNPGFEQASDYPVCGVSAVDALEFCRWLTAEERAQGVISEAQYYRLPFGDEWETLVGPFDHPWDPQLKPQGNFAGEEAAGAPGWTRGRGTLPDTYDGFPRTAPVGSFLENTHGVFDLGGNVFEWCIERTLTLKAHMRGGSWDSNISEYFLKQTTVNMPPAVRNSTTGFRVILVERGHDCDRPSSRHETDDGRPLRHRTIHRQGGQCGPGEKPRPAPRPAVSRGIPGHVSDGRGRRNGNRPDQSPALAGPGRRSRGGDGRSSTKQPGLSTGTPRRPFRSQPWSTGGLRAVVHPVSLLAGAGGRAPVP